jgi:hypothetical protein
MALSNFPNLVKSRLLYLGRTNLLILAMILNSDFFMSI